MDIGGFAYADKVHQIEVTTYLKYFYSCAYRDIMTVMFSMDTINECNKHLNSVLKATLLQNTY